jgi:hypothetical protein
MYDMKISIAEEECMEIRGTSINSRGQHFNRYSSTDILGFCSVLLWVSELRKTDTHTIVVSCCHCGRSAVWEKKNKCRAMSTEMGQETRAWGCGGKERIMCNGKSMVYLFAPMLGPQVEEKPWGKLTNSFIHIHIRIHMCLLPYSSSKLISKWPLFP